MLSEKMAISAALGGNIRALASQPHRPHDHYHLWLNEKQKFPFVLRTQNRKRYSTLIVRSTLNKLESDLSNSDNRETEPARALLEILFAQTLKMEEKMSRHSGTSEDNELSINLEVLESDIRAALLALINTGEDLQDAERKVMSDQTELIRTKENLEHREEEIAASCAKQKQMEENLKKANGDLSCQARQIEDLKLLVEEQNRKITHSQSTLSLKLDELDRVRNELMKKTKEAAIMKSELESRDQLLNEANEIIKKQGAEIQELQKVVKDKECGLAKSLHLRKVEEERLKIAEANLEKQTVDWLSARRELNVLAEQASKNTNDVKETSKDVKRVEKLLSVVRSELISSQESLASSRRKLDDQAHQLEKQQLQLNEQKLSMMSYTKSLKDAQTEVENERTKWRAAQTQKEELELKLALERELLERVQEDLNKEKFFLENATQEIASLQKELHQKQMEFSDAQALLQVKESELVEARLEIQNLKSEAASLQLILNEKDQAIWSAQNKLADVNSEIADLKTLNDSKEDQLILATGRLKKKEELALVMQHDLDDIKFKFSEVVTVIERIAQLTSELVSSAEGSISSCLLGKGILATEVEEDAKMQKQLDAELVSMKELLRVKEIELLTARRALTVKDEELNAVTSMWNAREKEMAKMKEGLWEDSNGSLKKSYALAQERVGGKSIVKNLAIEKLQLNTSWFEAKAINTDKCMGLDIGSVTLPTNDVSLHRRDECLEEAGREVANLLALTENLVEDAGIGGTGDTVL